MITLPLHNKRNFDRQVQAQVVWLESEHYEKAISISQNINGEKNQWKAYLNELALLGFTEWLQQHIPHIDVEQDSKQQERVYLQVGEFKVQLITVDNLYNIVTIPQVNITSPQLAAHFYVLIEVLEEAEQIIIHGIIRHDELSAIKNLKHEANQQSEICEIPLSNFDAELNNLLLYTQFLKVEAIPLPIIKNQETKTVTQPLVNLAQWWSGVIEEGWQRLEEILTPPTFVFGGATRSISSSDTIRERGEVFDFGTLLNGKKFVLVVKMKHGTNQEKNVLVQILSQTEDCLPQGLKLKITLNHNTLEGESETVIARKSDRIIQLEFSEPSNTLFKVEAVYQDAEIIKEFAL